MNESGTKLCKVCRSEIASGAKKCIHCDSFQNWRGVLGLSNTTLSLIIALVSVVSIFIANIDKFITKPEKVQISVIDQNDDDIKFAISNSGEQAAVVSPAAVFLVPGNKHMFSLEILRESSKVTSDLVIKPEEIKIFTARLHDSFKRQFKSSMIESSDECSFSLKITTITGDQRWAKGKFKCNVKNI